MKNKFKITLENEFGVYSVERNNNVDHIGDYINAFRSVLYSAGFSEMLINEYTEYYEPDFRDTYLGDI